MSTCVHAGAPVITFEPERWDANTSTGTAVRLPAMVIERCAQCGTEIRRSPQSEWSMVFTAAAPARTGEAGRA